MAERKINAKTYMLFIDPAGGTDWSLVVCLNSVNYNLSVAVQDASSYCGPDQSAGDATSTVGLDAQYMLSPDADRISAAGIFTLAQDKTTFSWKISAAIPEAGDITKDGLGFFSAYAETHNKDTVSGFTGTIAVQGLTTQTEETGS
jgi:hypothetical protein